MPVACALRRWQFTEDPLGRRARILIGVLVSCLLFRQRASFHTFDVLAPPPSGIFSFTPAGPTDRKYLKSHEWVKVDGSVGTVGITSHAADELGDIVHVELPDLGASVTARTPTGTVESVKATSELYTPVSGTVVEVNDPLTETPEIVNSDALGDGWLWKVELSKPEEMDELMDSEAYEKSIGDH